MYIDKIWRIKNSYNNLCLSLRICRRQILSLTGFTIIELMISMALLTMAVAGISLVYVTAERMCDSGSGNLSTEYADIQQKSQSPEEFISRIIRLASNVTPANFVFGNDIELDIPRDSNKRFYFIENEGEEGLGSIFYDPDTSLDEDEVELHENVYRVIEDGVYQPVFSRNLDDFPYVIRVYFGYFKGDEIEDENRRKVEFKVKMRNA